VPTSLLIDPEGRLVAVYRGRVNIERLVADTEMLSQPNERALFSGRWFTGPSEQSLSPLVGELFKEKYVSEAIEFMADNNARLREEKEYEKLLNKAGSERLKQGRVRDAAEYFQDAIDINPDYLLALNNQAWIMATDSDESLRNGAKAVEYALRAVEVARDREPDVLGTLAAAFAEAGRFEEAVDTAEDAIRLAGEIGAKRIEKGLQQEVVFYRAGKPYRVE